jgi:hypothetical protein
MTSIEVVKATIERCTVELVKIDHFHLCRLDKYKALIRVRERLQQEMIDAVYNSPERADTLAMEVRNLADMLQGIPGPVIDKLMGMIIPRWLPNG